MRTIIKAIFGTLLISSALSAVTINLSIGESFTTGNKTIVCGGGGDTNNTFNNYPNNIQLNVQKSDEEKLNVKKTCQYFDKREERCLFTKTTYKKGQFTCETYCQHWDRFFDKCLYTASCTYNPKAKTFTQEECVRWDKRDEKCLENTYNKQEL